MELKNAVDRRSYALGINMAQSVREFPFELNGKALIAGFSDIVSSQQPAISQEEYVELMHNLQQEMQQESEKQQAAAREVLEKNRSEQQEFIAANLKNEGVKETASGLQYKVLKEGEGEKPTKEHTVRVHYTGKLLDGTVFDSSVERGEPAEFGVGQVIAGWTEALQNMRVGAKHRLFIPSELAYGERGAGQAIAPGAMLIFDVELLDIVN